MYWSVCAPDHHYTHVLHIETSQQTLLECVNHHHHVPCNVTARASH